MYPIPDICTLNACGQFIYSILIPVWLHCKHTEPFHLFLPLPPPLSTYIRDGSVCKQLWFFLKFLVTFQQLFYHLGRCSCAGLLFCVTNNHNILVFNINHYLTSVGCLGISCSRMGHTRVIGMGHFSWIGSAPRVFCPPPGTRGPTQTCSPHCNG